MMQSGYVKIHAMFLPLATFKQAAVERDGKLILNIADCQLVCGEHVAIIGPNGSGKSTLLQLLTAETHPLYRPEPPVTLFGQTSWTLAEMRARIGFVSQDIQTLYTRECTGRTVILSGFFGTIDLYQEPTAQQQKLAEATAKKLGITHLLERTMDKMSTGEARRCLIGRAIVFDPEVLVFDEPTNALDIQARSTFLETVRSLTPNHSLVLVTHSIEEIIPEITRVILLKQGRIFADGPKEKILTSKNISDLFDMPIAISARQGYYTAIAQPRKI